MKTLDKLVHILIDNVHSSSDLKLISDTLEELAEKKSFRSHASAIASDSSLTNSQKKTQLIYLIRSLDVDLLSEFFTKELTEDRIWLFSSDKIDYFDQFVRAFQMATEEMQIVNLTTSVPLGADDVEKIAKDLGESFGAKILLSHEVNPSIVGGAQVRVGNMIYDFSLKTKFKQFEHGWLSSINETTKLTGRYED